MVEDLNSETYEAAPQHLETDAMENDSYQAENQHDDAESKQERNWKEARKSIRERDERIAYMESQMQKQTEMLNKFMEMTMQKQEPEAPDEFANIDPDDFPTWGQASKKFASEAEKIAERKFQELKRKEQEAQALEEQKRFRERLQAKYSDFDNVVNPNTIAIFEEQNPELAKTIMEIKDPYKMGLQTYHYIKLMNLGEQASTKKHAKEAQSKLEQNEKTLPSIQSFDKRPIADAFNYKEADYTQLYQEMTNYASKGGFSY